MLVCSSYKKKMALFTRIYSHIVELKHKGRNLQIDRPDYLGRVMTMKLHSNQTPFKVKTSTKKSHTIFLTGMSTKK